jgi:AraC-like DNA-binding protein
MTSEFDQHFTIGSVAALIAQSLRTYDCDPAPLFAAAGIDMATIADANSRYPVTQTQKLWKLAVEKTRDPSFGLKTAELFQPAAMRGLGLAWLASDSLRDALNRLVRFSRFLSTGSVVWLEEIDERVDLVITGPEKFPGFAFAAIDLGMAAFLRMCQITVGQPIHPVLVTLQRARPEDTEPFERVFRSPIEYEAPANRLCFDKAIVDAPTATPSPELARINDQTVIDYLARFDRSSIAMQVRAQIIEQLPDGTPHQDAIAQSLHVSLRSLQRRLKDEDTSFKQLLEGTRRELALQYIRESHRPIGEITYLLGFSEHSNFTRAFKRWTGYSPAEFRDSNGSK